MYDKMLTVDFNYTRSTPADTLIDLKEFKTFNVDLPPVSLYIHWIIKKKNNIVHPIWN